MSFSFTIILCNCYSFFFADPSLCVSDCRGADFTAARRPCQIYWMENEVLLSGLSC